MLAIGDGNSGGGNGNGGGGGGSSGGCGGDNGGGDSAGESGVSEEQQLSYGNPTLLLSKAVLGKALP